MSGRQSKQARAVRRLSTDSGDEEEMDWSDQRQRRHNKPKALPAKGASKSLDVSRPRRNVSGATTVSRDPPSSPSAHQTLRLTVKTSSNKLREATAGSTSSRPSRGAGVVAVGKDVLEGGEIVEGKRARTVKKSYVVESESDEDEEIPDADDEEDAEDEEIEEEEAMDDDAEGEDDEDADGDIDMDIPPPPPTIKISRATKDSKPTITVKPSGKSDGKTVEQKETAESDDEELSELESELEEEEEGMQLDNEEDAEGEEEEIEVVDDEEEEDDEDDLDSDDDTPGGGSRASTPNLANLTKRQRARLEEGGSGHLLALPDEVQVKKHLTAEEHAMRRAEMARRRKNLSEKRNEEEKMETINKLLKKQAPKTNARRGAFAGSGAGGDQDAESQQSDVVYSRWVSSREGNRVAVPEEWIGGPVGAVFGGMGKGMGGKLIQEVE